MRKSALRQFPLVRISLAALLVLMLSLVLAGCGGGGGGNNNGGNNNGGNNNGGNNNGGGNPPPNQNSNLAFLVGRVISDTRDSQGNPIGVANATVSVPQTSIATQTDSTGNFTLLNVPLTATQVIVSAAVGSGFSSYATFHNTLYNETTQLGGPCGIPVGQLLAGRNSLSDTVTLASGGSPPAPPLGGCPQ